MVNNGQKNDRKDGKLMWELLPLREMEEVVRVYTEGAKKYAPNSWQNLENGAERYRAALLRHMVEYMKGNDYDEETGLLHCAQIAWNGIAMLHFQMKRLGMLGNNPEPSIVNPDAQQNDRESDDLDEALFDDDFNDELVYRIPYDKIEEGMVVKFSYGFGNCVKIVNASVSKKVGNIIYLSYEMVDSNPAGKSIFLSSDDPIYTPNIHDIMDMTKATTPEGQPLYGMNEFARNYFTKYKNWIWRTPEGENKVKFEALDPDLNRIWLKNKAGDVATFQENEFKNIFQAIE